MKSKTNKALRRLYSDKILDLTNLGVGTTLFGQFIAGKKFSWDITIIGLIILVLGYFMSYILHPKN
ncbi:hypothetical protein COS31_05375 [Candidatus Roizmanbacteria bacterium CG02_land_8_20_14_3_00_36_15]|uniref:Uncharacterized protein n=2 Tax=Candidatus Roizmaniibacteriota TaxID=1752723 RepID=A0A2M8KMR6_9BACT|nr:MAG: hypothetical protein COS51_04750 [Candidatus Roizmanbacteria bacterium CG03_land_8_20_14_0_80_36_21]PIV37307.1 MAG: hypothetical protein COS31_05375 [Candidatus Roizmanbacteria bacterium CG02_land_8_20_14_3_00_36_15]PIY70624.1 MAG: hypothetical protein COY89_00185 [Candidatus Roizmanbacteria bacterium CG_4_10_14_0_8_um_filter_36_36]PJA52446.1 MAG: hypothetical protein CO166_05780 [Candidatus Roizmanbacteria bacterium CG_4_9_14_3_um_filter_36_11]PJC81732.1 MAG: hypothetical protein CO007